MMNFRTSLVCWRRRQSSPFCNAPREKSSIRWHGINWGLWPCQYSRTVHCVHSINRRKSCRFAPERLRKASHIGEGNSFLPRCPTEQFAFCLSVVSVWLQSWLCAVRGFADVFEGELVDTADCVLWAWG